MPSAALRLGAGLFWLPLARRLRLPLALQLLLTRLLRLLLRFELLLPLQFELLQAHFLALTLRRQQLLVAIFGCLLLRLQLLLPLVGLPCLNALPQAGHFLVEDYSRLLVGLRLLLARQLSEQLSQSRSFRLVLAEPRLVFVRRKIARALQERELLGLEELAAELLSKILRQHLLPQRLEVECLDRCVMQGKCEEHTRTPSADADGASSANLQARLIADH